MKTKIWIYPLVMMGMLLMLMVSMIAQAQEVVKDYDRNVYKTVKIGTQVWMAENLKVTHYRNGDAISNITDETQWSNLTTGAYCIYNNDANYVKIYGTLYNWYAVNDSRNIAPQGWHIPSYGEWWTLVSYLDANALFVMGTVSKSAGGKMKEIGTTHWNSPNTGATNQCRFTGLPGGGRYLFGVYNDLRNYGVWWSATPLHPRKRGAWYHAVDYDNAGVYHGITDKSYGFSVRCVKD